MELGSQGVEMDRVRMGELGEKRMGGLSVLFKQLFSRWSQQTRAGSAGRAAGAEGLMLAFFSLRGPARAPLLQRCARLRAHVQRPKATDPRHPGVQKAVKSLLGAVAGCIWRALVRAGARLLWVVWPCSQQSHAAAPGSGFNPQPKPVWGPTVSLGLWPGFRFGCFKIRILVLTELRRVLPLPFCIFFFPYCRFCWIWKPWQDLLSVWFRNV